MSCEDKNKNPTLRCPMEGINWAPNDYFKTCPVCGTECDKMCVDEHVLSWHESKRLEAELVAERNEREREAPQPAVGAFASAPDERVITAAVAALNFDLDRWLDADPDEWDVRR